MDNLWFDKDEIYNGIRIALGASIQSPIVVALGFEFEDGTKRIYVEGTEGENNRYYFHELPGAQSFIGEVYATGGKTISPDIAKYGLPIRIKQDELSYGSSPQWILDGLDPYISSQFVLPATVTGDDGDGGGKKNYVQLSQFVPGLLSATDPSSMQCRIRGAFYGAGEVVEYWTSTNTGTFGTSGIKNFADDVTIAMPTSTESDYIVAVQRSVITGAITYILSNPVPSELNWVQLWEYDRLQSTRYTVFSRPYPNNQITGYVRLKYGMTVIKAANIFNAQEILHKPGNGARNILQYEFTSPAAGTSSTTNLYLTAPNEYIDKVSVVINDDDVLAAGGIRIYENGITPDMVATTEIDVKKAGLYITEMAYNATRNGRQFIKAVINTTGGANTFSGTISLYHGQVSEL